MDKLLENSEMTSARFTCECLSHVLDVFYEHNEKGFWDLTFEVAPIGYDDRTLWERVKLVWAYLTNKTRNHSFWEFHLRREDAKDFVNIMCSTLHDPNTR